MFFQGLKGLRSVLWEELTALWLFISQMGNLRPREATVPIGVPSNVAVSACPCGEVESVESRVWIPSCALVPLGVCAPEIPDPSLLSMEHVSCRAWRLEARQRPASPPHLRPCDPLNPGTEFLSLLGVAPPLPGLGLWQDQTREEAAWGLSATTRAQHQGCGQLSPADQVPRCRVHGAGDGAGVASALG